jgi:hypothetical protein
MSRTNTAARSTAVSLNQNVNGVPAQAAARAVNRVAIR